MNEEEELKTIIGKNATINLYYGGYEVEVINKSKLAWGKLFECLFKYGYSVFVTQKDGRLSVVAKQVY
jgi:hypothetical protein